MLKTFILKELREIFRDKILIISAFSLLLLLFLSLTVSYLYSTTLNKQIDAANETSRDQWDSQGDKNQHSAAHYGIYLFQPKSANSFWDYGIEKFAGSTIFIEPHGRNSPQFKVVEDSPILAKWEEFTPSFVLLVLFPLMIIWICSGAISKEYEARTFEFLMSQGISWKKLILAKTLSRWIILLLLTVPTILIMIVVLQFFTTTSFDWQVWSLIGIVYLLFLGVFIHISLLCSAHLKNTTAAILTMLGFWLFTVWIVPRLCAELSQNQIPLISEWQFNNNLHEEIEEKGINRHDQSNPRTKAFTQTVLQDYGVSEISELPINFNGLILQESEEFNNKIINRHYEKLFETYDKQSKFIQRLSFISPFMLSKQLSMSLSKTDLYSFLHFQKEADRYRKLFNKTINNDLINSGSVKEQRFIRDSSFWKEIPQFKYKPITLNEIVIEYWLSFILLFIWFLISLSLLFLLPNNHK